MNEELRQLIESIAKEGSDDEKFAIYVNKEVFPASLDSLLYHTAQTGEVLYKWNAIRFVFKWKMIIVLDGFFRKYGFLGPVTETFDSRKNEILEAFDDFEDEPPFTIQRIAEIIMRANNSVKVFANKPTQPSTNSNDPTQQLSEYKSTHGILNGLARVLAVYSSDNVYG